MDDIVAALPSFSPGAYAFTFDLKKGYYHVSLHPEVLEYFGLSFDYEGETFYAVYTVGPFGLATMPWVFTKLMRPWVAKWRGEGLNIFLYLDDGLGVAPDHGSAVWFSKKVRSDLKKAGIIEQSAKCCWSPQPWAEWLGLHIDFEKFELIIPEGKILKALYAVENALEGNCSPKLLMKAAGHLNSFAVVLGKEVLINSKPLFVEVTKYVLGEKGWNKRIILSKEAKDCLVFWKEFLPSPRRSLYQKPLSCVIFSDASNLGGAAFIDKFMTLTNQKWSNTRLYKQLKGVLKSSLFYLL